MDFSKIKGFFALDKSMVVLILANAFWAGHFLWKGFESKYYQSLGASIPTIGILLSLVSVFYTVTSLAGGYMSDIYGRKHVSAIAYLLSSFLLLALFLATNWIFLIPVFIFSGVLAGLADPSFQTLVTETLPKKKRATGQSVMYLSGTIVSLVAIPIGAWIVQEYGILNGSKINLFYSFLLNIIGSLIFIFFARETLKRIKKSKINLHISESIKFLTSIPKKVKMFVLLISMLTFADALMSAFMIFYALDIIQIQPLQWGIIGSAQYAIATVVIFLGGKLSDKYGRRHVLLISFLLSIFIPFLFIFSKNFLHLLFVNILIGISTLGFSSIFPFITDNTKIESRAKTMGIVHSMMSLSAIPGPFIAGFLYAIMPQSPFILAGIIFIPVFAIGLKFLK